MSFLKEIQMLMRIFLATIVFFSGATSTLMANSEIDHDQISVLSMALAKQNVTVGVFEIPGKGDELLPMSDGDFVELSSDYIEATSKFSLVKLQLVSKVRGETDQVIFVHTPFSHSSNEKKMKWFPPQSSTKWLLFLKSPIKSKDSKIDKKLSELPFINEKTYFEIFDGSDTAINLEWPTDVLLVPDHIISSDNTIVDDVKMMINMQNTVGAIPENDEKAWTAIFKSILSWKLNQKDSE